MRIIGGTYGGRTLTTLRDLSIRPTTDRAKQTMFDILTNRVNFEGIEVLDLFAGSGSLGLEAISRGARSAVFVEKSLKSISALEKNIETLSCRERCTIHQADVFWYLKNVRHQFDIVFVDPPYKLERIPELPAAIYGARITKPSSYIVMEHSRETPVVVSESMYEIIKKPFGQTTMLILKPLQSSEGLNPSEGSLE
ncbi:MAG: 16S rRNA (guanine(966)-N(2))-methyltransferase RsmD [Ignavibacteriae bacterium]|nr:16S rRNA (guanine(966)-N(2))-methyltransferase RsmD [Ignavibacteriota bacterium]